MKTAEYTDFRPDWVSAPGETITDILEEKHLSRAEFAQNIGFAIKDADDLLRGGLTITTQVAQRLEAVLGASAAFWMSRESQYREDLARLEREADQKSKEKWLRALPLKDMIHFGWLPSIPRSTDQLAACLRFFGVVDVAEWYKVYRNVIERAAFRTSPSFESQAGAVAAWLRQGEIKSASIHCSAWNASRFREMLSHVRALTRKKDPGLFLADLTKRCAECGVAVVILRAPTGCRASGATRFISTTKAVLMLSFRYLSDDHFWFTFFHEAGHLLLHGKDLLFLEVADEISDQKEREANEFAARMLVPFEFESELLQLRADAIEVIRFARSVGVSPGIIVGQLQHLGLVPPSHLNRLKRRFRWKSA